MTDARTYAVPARARTLYNESSTSGRKRWAAGGVATMIAVGTLGVFAPPASADVRAGRTVEIFHGRNIVAVEGYPVGVPVKVEVLRGEEVIGFATYTPRDVDGHQGFFEINHVGDGDCWQSPYTPNILPGDIVRTTVSGEPSEDTSATRDVFINQEAEFLTGTDPNTRIIRVTGHAKSTTAAPFGAGDIVELRMNKVSKTNGWETNDGRPDLRLPDVLPFVQPDGTYTHDFRVSVDDWNDAQTTGIDISTVWIRGTTELTFYDGEPEATQGCPPPLPDDRIAPNDAPGLTASTGAGPNGSTAVFLDWTAATDNEGGSGVKNYEVYLDNGTTPLGSVLAPSTSFDTRVTSLPRTFRVVAVDGAGNKSPGATITVGAPTAPTGVTAEAGDGSATVSWTAPSTAGIPAVTGYKVRVFEGSSQTPLRTVDVNNVATSTQVTGLTNGTGYAFDVAAVNSHGTGAFSGRTTAVTPAPPSTATVPAAPAAPTAIAGNGQASVSWSAPADGGSRITGYSVRAYAGDSTTPASTTSATGTSVVVPNLVNGTSYTFDVVATNGVGSGPASARSSAVTPVAPATVAGAPTNVTATAGNTTAAVGWSAPASNGGSAITRYDVRVYAGGATTPSRTVTGTTATNLTVPGLTNGISYRFDVIAVNAVGDSQASALSNAVTPTGGDVAPPTVSSRSPNVNGVSIGVATSATATFSEAVQGVSGTTAYLRRTGTTTNIGATVTYNATSRTATLDPTSNLANDTNYTVTLTSGIRDAAGNALALTTWSFTTGPAPTVTAQNPTAGFSGFDRDNNITVTFSEVVQGVSATTFELRRGTATGTLVGRAVSRNGTTNQWILNPDLRLDPGTTYTVRLVGGPNAIRDMANNPLLGRSWSFTTGSV